MTGFGRSGSVATPPLPDTSPDAPVVSPLTDQTSAPARPPRFTSIDEALAFIRRRVNVPVVLPDGLPRGVVLSPRHPVYVYSTSPVGATLRLIYGTKKVIDIEYGTSAFDGCGPGERAREVRIGDKPAVVSAHRHKTGWWTELIWPATLAHPFGRYGLIGSLPPGRMLRMARSMSVVHPRAEVSHNC